MGCHSSLHGDVFRPTFSHRLCEKWSRLYHAYFNLLNDRERAPDDQPFIGIILCAEKDDVEVEYALKSKVNPIGVAEYQLQARLPAEFKGRLPTARQLAGVVRGALPSER